MCTLPQRAGALLQKEKGEKIMNHILCIWKDNQFFSYQFQPFWMICIAILKINIIKYILFSRISNENYQKKINKLSVKISSKLEKKHPFHKLFVVILNWIVNSILDQKHLCSFGTEIKLDVHLHVLHLFLQSSHQRTWTKNHWKSRCIH